MRSILFVIFAVGVGYALLARVHEEADLGALGRRILKFGILPRGVVKGEVGPSVWSFAGRAGRAEWATTVFTTSVISLLMAQATRYGELLSLPWTLAALAVTSRRLHDLGQSGWIQLISIVLTAILFSQTKPEMFSGIGDASRFLSQTNLELISLVSGTALAMFGVALALLPGSIASNCYGEAKSRRRRLF